MLTDEQANNRFLWAEALESGEYEQARRDLSVVSTEGEVAYCCLGVAQEVFDPEGWVIGRDAWEDRDVIRTALDISPKVKDALGLHEFEERRQFSAMNDGGNSFQMIADRIRTDAKPYANAV